MNLKREEALGHNSLMDSLIDAGRRSVTHELQVGELIEIDPAWRFGNLGIVRVVRIEYEENDGLVFIERVSDDPEA